MTYKLTNDGYVIKDGTTKVPTNDVPGFDLHTETVAYREWLSSGGVPEPADPPSADEITPRSCTRRQGRLALLQSGLLDAVEASIAAIEDPAARRAAQIEYEADTWERDNAFLQAMWAQQGGTPEQLYELFVLAVTL